MENYTVSYYGSDGLGVIENNVYLGTLSDCLSYIRAELGVKRLMAWRKWDGTDDDLFAYHETRIEGCGGFSVKLDRKAI